MSQSLETANIKEPTHRKTVKAKDGTFQTPKSMRKCLEKHLRRCVSKEEREALFKEHPKPDLPVCAPPRVDKFMTDFLGKRLPKERDHDLSKIQWWYLRVSDHLHLPGNNSWKMVLKMARRCGYQQSRYSHSSSAPYVW